MNIDSSSFVKTAYDKMIKAQDKLNTESRDYDNQKNYFDTQSSQFDAKFTGFTNMASKCENDAFKKDGEITSKENAISSMVNQANKGVKDLESQKSKISGDITKLESQLLTEDQKKGIQVQMTKAPQSKPYLQKQLDNDAKIKQQITAKKKELEVVNNQLSAKKIEQQNVEAKRNEQNKEIAKLKEAASQLRAEAKSYKTQAEDTKKEKVEFQNSIDLAKELKDVDDAKVEYEKATEEYNIAEAEDQKNKVANAGSGDAGNVADVNSSWGRVLSADKQISGIKSNLAIFNNKTFLSDEELSSLNAQKGELSQLRDSLKDNMDKVTCHIADYNAKEDYITHVLTQLKEIDDTKASIDDKIKKSEIAKKDKQIYDKTKQDLSILDNKIKDCKDLDRLNNLISEREQLVQTNTRLNNQYNFETTIQKSSAEFQLEVANKIKNEAQQSHDSACDKMGITAFNAERKTFSQGDSIKDAMAQAKSDSMRFEYQDKYQRGVGNTIYETVRFNSNVNSTQSVRAESDRILAEGNSLLQSGGNTDDFFSAVNSFSGRVDDHIKTQNQGGAKVKAIGVAGATAVAGAVNPELGVAVYTGLTALSDVDDAYYDDGHIDKREGTTIAKDATKNLAEGLIAVETGRAVHGIANAIAKGDKAVSVSNKIADYTEKYYDDNIDLFNDDKGYDISLDALTDTTANFVADNLKNVSKGVIKNEVKKSLKHLIG